MKGTQGEGYVQSCFSTPVSRCAGGRDLEVKLKFFLSLGWHRFLLILGMFTE